MIDANALERIMKNYQKKAKINCEVGIIINASSQKKVFAIPVDQVIYLENQSVNPVTLSQFIINYQKKVIRSKEVERQAQLFVKQF